MYEKIDPVFDYEEPANRSSWWGCLPQGVVTMRSIAEARRWAGAALDATSSQLHLERENGRTTATLRFIGVGFDFTIDVRAINEIRTGKNPVQTIRRSAGIAGPRLVKQ